MDTQPNDSTKLYISDTNKAERIISDAKYADKLIEKIVLGAAAAGGTALIGLVVAKYL